MKTTVTDVIIIGAGPTGLSLACQLVRFGIDFVLIEKNEGVTPHSKALGVQARTLEIYEQLGLAQPAIEQGEIAGRIRLLAGGRVRGEMLFGTYGQGQSPYPYMLFLEQSKNEELLYEYVRSHNKEVRWKTELEGFAQDGSGVTAQVKTAGGEVETIRAKYLVGCDGARSRVRHDLGLKFEGSTFERLFYVADAQIDWALPHDAVQVALARDVFTAFFPMKGEKRYRIIGTFPEGRSKDDGEVVYEEIEQEIKKQAQLELEISDVKWFSLYKVHSRRVNKFSEGRCFVAGDAAHIHSPTGAQGMNTGIQDVYNLAWKLALVVKRVADERLLDTYNEERLPNAKRLLETTDRMFELVAGSHWLLGFIRINIFPVVAGFVSRLEGVRKRFFPLLSQIGIAYRKSSLSDRTAGPEFRVKAGDRMPYFLVGGQSIYDWLRTPKFHWLSFSSGGSDQLRRQEVEAEYGQLIDYVDIPRGSHVREIFGTDQPFEVLVRPDNHIGCISAGNSPKAIEDYLDRIVPGARNRE